MRGGPDRTTPPEELEPYIAQVLAFGANEYLFGSKVIEDASGIDWMQADQNRMVLARLHTILTPNFALRLSLNDNANLLIRSEDFNGLGKLFAPFLVRDFDRMPRREQQVQGDRLDMSLYTLFLGCHKELSHESHAYDVLQMEINAVHVAAVSNNVKVAELYSRPKAVSSLRRQLTDRTYYSTRAKSCASLFTDAEFDEWLSRIVRTKIEREQPSPAAEEMVAQEVAEIRAKLDFPTVRESILATYRQLVLDTWGSLGSDFPSSSGLNLD